MKLVNFTEENLSKIHISHFSPTFKASDYLLSINKTILELKKDLQKYGIIARVCAKLTYWI